MESGLIFNQLICEFESRRPCHLFSLRDPDCANVTGQIVRDKFHLTRPHREVAGKAEGYLSKTKPACNRPYVFSSQIMNAVVSIREVDRYSSRSLAQK